MDSILFNVLCDKPSEMLPIVSLILFIIQFEQAVNNVYHSLHADEMGEGETASFQVQLNSDANPQMIRDLSSDQIGRLVYIPGIITSASKASIKATRVCIRCRVCFHTMFMDVKAGFRGIQLPRQCQQTHVEGLEREKCGLDPYDVAPEESDYIDQQTLKIQEAPELVPTGEMPRSFLMTADRFLVDRVQPGSRVTIVGVYDVFNRGGSAAQTVTTETNLSNTVKVSYIKCVGIQSERHGAGGFSMPILTQEEEEKIKQVAKDKSIYTRISRSIGNAIFGSDDIKKAIACLLFGGTAKQLPDGMRLRGDINVLLLGDPSTAKSQFLKYVERVAPISVYTSGKGSSAAGLTASVLRDASTGEF